MQFDQAVDGLILSRTLSAPLGWRNIPKFRGEMAVIWQARASCASGDWLTGERARLRLVLLAICALAMPARSPSRTGATTASAGRSAPTSPMSMPPAPDAGRASPRGAFDPPGNTRREKAIFGAATSVLRLALSAVLPGSPRCWPRALWAGACVWQAATLCALSLRWSRAHLCRDPRRRCLARLRRLSGRVRQSRSRPQRLPHRRAVRRRAAWLDRRPLLAGIRSACSPTSRNSAC